MTAYYNEIDLYAAQWLRNLINAGHIAPGDVDERSIEDVKPIELREYTQCHFFAGVGVWSYAMRCAGWPDERPVWTGSCPCQPFSQAGKNAGFADKRHLWPAWFHLIEQCRPPVIFGEQIASKAALNWLDLVYSDLEAADYTFGVANLCAASIGAPHIRQRLYFVGNINCRNERGQLREKSSTTRTDENKMGWHIRERVGSFTIRTGTTKSEAGPVNSYWRNADWLRCRDEKWRPVEPGTFPLAHGATARMGRLRAYGNAIVAPLAQTFIEAVMECLP